MVLPDLASLDFGAYATVVGMGGVFVVLSVLALMMWFVGMLLHRPAKSEKFDDPKSPGVSDGLTDRELMVIAAAVEFYESRSGFNPTFRPRSWKNAGRAELLELRQW